MRIDSEGNPIEDETVETAAETEADEGATPETAETATESESAEDADVQGEWLDENRYRFADGTIVDPEGNEVEAEPEPTPEPAKPARAAATTAATTTPRTATEISATSDQRPIYSREQLEQAIYSEAKTTEIADLLVTDPAEGMKRQRDLDRQYREAEGRLLRHASQVFEQELDDYATQAPQTVERYARQIGQYKEQLTPEQQQQPGAVKYVISQVLAAQLAADPLAAEEFAMRSLPQTRLNTGTAPTGAARPAAKPAPKRQPEVIPPALRNVGPGSARKPDTSRRPSGTQASRDPLVATFQQMYGLTVEQAKARAEEMRAQQAQRGAR